MCKQQMPLQVLREILICLCIVVTLAIRPNFFEPAPLLVPIVFVNAAIMVATLGDTYLEEVREVEHRRSRRITTAGVPPDPYAVKVNPWRT